MRKFLIGFVIFKLSTGIVIDLPDGKVEGLTNTTRAGTTYHSFLALRYAEPPLGNLRFQPTTLINPWEGIYDGTEEKQVCYQVGGDSPKESEDCLFINVFTPADLTTKFNANLTVMVWIHGGAFNSGAGYMTEGGVGPKFFMDNNVVLAAFNYRLGPFGFLSGGDEIFPGNYGLKDQVLALKWIQNNIAAFGGDPSKVTIFGQSAGAASVSYQVLSPQSAGLYRAAIMESGSALCPWAYQRNQTEITFRLAQIIDPTFDSRNSADLLRFFQSVPASNIDAATTVLANTMENPSDWQSSKGFFYAPVIEPEHEGAFLTEFQYGLFKSGNYNQVPTFSGMVSEECLAFSTYGDLSALWDSYDQSPSDLVPWGLHVTNPQSQEIIGEEIKDFFTDGKGFNRDLATGIKFHSVLDFDKGLIKQAELMSAHTTSYFYELTYSGPMGYYGYRVPGCGNVTHAEETRYFFSLWYSNEIPDNTDLSYFPESDQKVHYRIMALWTNFAKYLNPTPPGIDVDVLQNVTWEPAKPNDFKYLDIGVDLVLTQGYPKEDKYLFWSNLFQKYAVPPLDTF